MATLSTGGSVYPTLVAQGQVVTEPVVRKSMACQQFAVTVQAVPKQVAENFNWG